MKTNARITFLTEQQYDLLVAVMNDACHDDPRDIDLRQLRNVVRNSMHVDRAPRERIPALLARIERSELAAAALDAAPTSLT